MVEDARIKKIIETGRDMFLRGLVSSHAGNISVRDGSRVYITRKGGMTSRLSPVDIVEVDMERSDDPAALLASSEYVIHRAIYLATGARAVVHAHPPYATLLSMTGELVPVDVEGGYHLGRVPVASPRNPTASEEAARAVSELMKTNRVVLIRAHGSFSRGETLEEAYMLTSTLEASAFYLHHLEGTGR
ncbi:MAG: Methylthioribulose-1-phosphate dehydratase [Syntrophorhabdus sp. PtaB.Bin184]|nr:MAG: Methylthioribulose-1-phosphate dehydratase [Syntrophorhabdus sp. PtaB.Bin184]